MAFNKKLTPEEKRELEIQRYIKNINYSSKRWDSIAEYGGTDPRWTDGESMNLLRNHIIYDKRKLEELCSDNLPKEYYIPTPPLVDQNFMAANGEYVKVRTEQIGADRKLTTKPVDLTISLFGDENER